MSRKPIKLQRSSRSLALLLMVAAISALMSAPGCMVEQKRTDPWREWAEYVGYDLDKEGSKRKTKQLSLKNPTGQGYTIILQSFDGGSRYKKARKLMDQVNHMLGAQVCWIQENEDLHSVYRGRYFSDEDPQAQSDLKQIRNLIISGSRPFKGAELVEIGATKPKDAWDLRNHKGMYTLQIGFYNREFGKDYRKTAEEEVKRLREEDHDAYYYHGPNMSLITIGIFDHKKAFNIVNNKPVLNPEIRALQKVFPHNKKNGETFVDPRSQRSGPAGSFLANVPEI